MQGMIAANPDALLLLIYLRAHSTAWRNFTCPNALVLTLGWKEERLKKARARLIRLGYLEPVEPPYGRRPALYRWGMTLSPFVH
jgi:hypothetical protein